MSDRPEASTLAPAKVNLFLSVGPIDARGYHPLRTLFQAVGLYDTVRVFFGGGETAVVFDEESIPEDNSVTKAIALYSELTATPPVTVWVQKLIPLQSGLGGGSSDAAAVLRALQHLLGDPVSQEDLFRIALKVGADVPFFLVGGKARAEGYGEILTPLPDGPTRWLVLAAPAVGCPTGPMFQKLDLLEYEWKDWPSNECLYNDFERVAPCECIDLIERLRVHGAADSGLSGSGSAVFGIFNGKESAEMASRKLKAEGVRWTAVVPTLTRQDSTAKWLVPL